MQEQKIVRYGLSLNQTTTARDQSAIRAITLESESLGAVGALLCLIGLLLVLADIGR